MMKQILGSKTDTVCHLPSALQEIKAELIFSDNASLFISISQSLSRYFSLGSGPNVFGYLLELVRMINTVLIKSHLQTLLLSPLVSKAPFLWVASSLVWNAQHWKENNEGK